MDGSIFIHNGGNVVVRALKTGAFYVTVRPAAAPQHAAELPQARAPPAGTGCKHTWLPLLLLLLAT